MTDDPQIQTDKYLARLRESQETLASSLRRQRWHTQTLVRNHFRHKYGDDWREVMESKR